MLFRPATLRGIADGTVTRAFRRWDPLRVRPGGRQRTPVGLIAFDAVEPVARESLTEGDARDAGLTGLDELLALVDRRPSGEIYRVELSLAGPDPRVTLREAVPVAGQIDEISRRLDRLDRASRHGAWTLAVLRSIADHPGVRARSLLMRCGRSLTQGPGAGLS